MSSYWFYTCINVQKSMSLVYDGVAQAAHCDVMQYLLTSRECHVTMYSEII